MLPAENVQTFIACTARHGIAYRDRCGEAISASSRHAIPAWRPLRRPEPAELRWYARVRMKYARRWDLSSGDAIEARIEGGVESVYVGPRLVSRSGQMGKAGGHRFALGERQLVVEFQPRRPGLHVARVDGVEVSFRPSLPSASAPSRGASGGVPLESAGEGRDRFRGERRRPRPRALGGRRRFSFSAGVLAPQLRRERPSRLLGPEPRRVRDPLLSYRLLGPPRECRAKHGQPRRHPRPPDE